MGTGLKMRKGLGKLAGTLTAGLLSLGLSRIATAQDQQIDPSWLSSDFASKTVTFQLIAGLRGLNGGLNYNGFRDGGLTLVVPLGWRIEINFRNHDGVLPHSAEVIRPQTPLPTQPVEPAIPKAFTNKLLEGLPSEARDEMLFTAQPPGEYLIYCGVPGHGAAGMWIRLRVAAVWKPALMATGGGRDPAHDLAESRPFVTAYDSSFRQAHRRSSNHSNWHSQ